MLIDRIGREFGIAGSAAGIPGSFSEPPRAATCATGRYVERTKSRVLAMALPTVSAPTSASPGPAMASADERNAVQRAGPIVEMRVRDGGPDQYRRCSR